MKAALFDLDGVIVDTESQYTAFWTEIQRMCFPDNPAFPIQIKGKALTCIYSEYFPEKAQQEQLQMRLQAFESTMTYPYIKGVRTFLPQLRNAGVPAVIVTSSNQEKMKKLYSAIPDFKLLFTHILTAEHYTHSKPSPDCYISAAAQLGLQPEECVVFEDSLNGIEAGRLSGAYVVGLATTHPVEVLAPLCDTVISDFSEENLNKINFLFSLK